MRISPPTSVSSGFMGQDVDGTCGLEPEWLEHAALRNLFVCSELGTFPAGVFQFSTSAFQGQKQNEHCLIACRDVPDRLWSLLVKVVACFREQVDIS